MKTDLAPICQEHKTTLEWRLAIFEYTEDGVSIRVTGPWAWVCPEDNEASYPPAAFDELIATTRELLALAKQAKARRSAMREWMISID